MANALDTLRQTLDAIIAEAAADLDAQAAARAAEVAQALEQHTPVAVESAVSSALDGQRQWFVGLINERLEQLGEQTATATVLRHLRGVVIDD